MRSRYIYIASALMAMMGLTSCGTMFLEGGAAVPVYTSGVYEAGYGAGYDRHYGTSSIAYEEARRQAWYLTDKMGYELGLTPMQLEAVYEINLDYLLNMRGESSIYGSYWSRRNRDIFYVLDARQYNYFVGLEYFYRPVAWYNNTYVYHIYNYYDSPSHYYYSRPSYCDVYRGGRNREFDSYYAGRFGTRNGQPVVTNRPSNYQNFGNSRGRDNANGMHSGSQRATNGTVSFGNQSRGDSRFDNIRNNGGSFGSFGTTKEAKSSRQRPQPERRNDNSSFGGSRGGNGNSNSSFQSRDGYNIGNVFNNSGSQGVYSTTKTESSRPQAQPERRNDNSGFGGSRGGNYNSSSSTTYSNSSTTRTDSNRGNSYSTRITNSSYNSSYGTSTTRTQSTERSNSSSFSFGGSRNSAGSSSTIRQSPAPQPQNQNSSFGGRR